MFLDGIEVGFVNIRTAYVLEMIEYNGKNQWELFEKVHRSMAIKMPSIDAQLVTYKKFQELFGKNEILAQYSDESEVLKPVFYGMWSLEDVDSNLET